MASRDTGRAWTWPPRVEFAIRHAPCAENGVNAALSTSASTPFFASGLAPFAPTRAREPVDESGLHFQRHGSWTFPLHSLQTDHEQVSLPCGSGIVQFCVVPSLTITTFAVALPSYVMVSLRVVTRLAPCTLIVR